MHLLDRGDKPFPPASRRHSSGSGEHNSLSEACLEIRGHYDRAMARGVRAGVVLHRGVRVVHMCCWRGIWTNIDDTEPPPEWTEGRRRMHRARRDCRMSRYVVV